MLRKILLALTAVTAAALPAGAQHDWTPYADNPVIAFNFDATSTYLFRPAVIKRDGLYHMWYGKQVGPSQGAHSRSVGYAISQDGITWELNNLYALEPSGQLGTFDDVYAYSPTVVADADTLRMWYVGFGRLQINGLGYAWSVDGSTWTKVRGTGQGGSVFDKAMDPVAVDGVVSPTVVKKEGAYHLWYQKLVTSDGKARVGYARSANGINWTVVPGFGAAQSVVDVGDPNTFDEDQVWWPWTLYNKEEGIFEMWYQGIDSPAFGGVPRLGCARSTDGISWEKIPGTGDAGACSNSRAQPGVIIDDGVYKMWYSLTTNASPQNDEIGYAVSDPTTTSIDREEVPNALTSLDVFPNPSMASVRVQLELAKPARLTLRVVDLLGRSIFHRSLDNVPIGIHLLTWSGNRMNGAQAPAGAYVISIRDDSGVMLAHRIVQIL